ncbi:amidase [Granulicella arctica]|uniref:amidase n=1 Tax=Granulicella arctica TaxID=940613 RepID=UPI0021E05B94|nr:amidase [Granulicella arctica]
MHRKRFTCALAMSLLVSPALYSQHASSRSDASSQMDRDLLEIDVPRLHALYAHHKYTVTQVTQWYLDRIARYNPVYRPVIHVDAIGALAAAAHEEAEKGRHGPLWGVPILIKDNTCITGVITSDGWSGFNIAGKEFIPSTDASIVKNLRAAGAILLGHTNMPDFAASDTNFSSAGGRTGNAYDVRFSPGGSSGGTATALASNLAVFGQGTDTANSIRIPSSADSLVGLLPTRGLVSIAGIAPLDWLLDNTSPLARDVTDAAIALDVMAGDLRRDPLDFRTADRAANAQKLPYTSYLKRGALKGKRFGVPAFILNPVPAAGAAPDRGAVQLAPETREAFLKALDQMRSAGATIVLDGHILTPEFSQLIRAINTRPYRAEGTMAYLHDFGPSSYKTPEQYEAVAGAKFPPMLLGLGTNATPQRTLESDPDRDTTLFGPQQKALAEYDATLARFHLDGFVYPALQMPPNDETPKPGEPQSRGPHSATGWANKIGVPALVLPGGFYANGIPFGMELSTTRWHDGDLLGYGYAYEQATHNRRQPRLTTP